MIDHGMNPENTDNADVGLAIETSGPGGGVALGIGDRLLASRTVSATRPHAVEWLPALADLCRAHRIEPASIACVFVSIGPGSFTGLRIGVTTARIIALTAGARIVPVPTLEVIAQNALELPDSPPRIAVLIDARRGNAYGAAFVRGADGGYACADEAVERDPARFLAAQARLDPNCAVLGPGVAQHAVAVRECGLSILPETCWRPRAESVYALGRRLARSTPPISFRSVVPNYIRPPSAEEKLSRPAGGRP